MQQKLNVNYQGFKIIDIPSSGLAAGINKTDTFYIEASKITENKPAAPAAASASPMASTASTNVGCARYGNFTNNAANTTMKKVLKTNLKKLTVTGGRRKTHRKHGKKHHKSRAKTHKKTHKKHHTKHHKKHHKKHHSMKRSRKHRRM